MPASLADCSSKRDMAATLLKYCYHGSHCQSIPLFIGSPSAVSRPSSVVRCPLSVVPLHIRQVSRAGSKSSAATNAIRFVLHRVVGNRNSLKFPRPLPGNAARPMHNALRKTYLCPNDPKCISSDFLNACMPVVGWRRVEGGVVASFALIK